jgi:hypothetical protein
MKKERDDKIKLVGEIMDLEKSSIDSGEIEVSDNYYSERFDKLMGLSLYRLQAIKLNLKKNAKPD